MKKNKIIRDHLLFSGIPATGKSFFCRWLAREHQYVHWDFDQMINDPQQQTALRPLNGIINARNSAEAHAFKGQLPHRLAIDWGFPPNDINIVESLKSAGFRIFWFDGDRARARQEFITRDTVPVQAFNNQMPLIEEAWSRIKVLFTPNEINVLGADGKRMSENEIWEIVGRGAA